MASPGLCGGLERHRSRAFAENGAIPACVEGPQYVFGHKAEPVIMNDRFRLERSVVTDRHSLIGLTGTKGGGGFRHSQSASDPLVSDAGVGTLKIVANADMAHDVVRQVAQEPHRVH